jgi:hypothetical protein
MEQAVDKVAVPGKAGFFVDKRAALLIKAANFSMN